MGVATESKVMAGSETETGVNTDVGMDSKSVVDTSGNVSVAVGVVAGAGSMMGSVGADVGVGMGSMVVGTSTGDDAVAVVEVQAGMIAEMVSSACVAASEVSALAKVQHVTGEVVEVKVVAEVEVYMGTETVPSACVVVSELSVLAKAQHGFVMAEMDTVVEAGTDVVTVGDMHVGMSLEMVMAVGVAQGAEVGMEAVGVMCVETGMVTVGVSAKMMMSAGLAVGWTEGKTGPCAAFKVDVAGQDMNTTRGVLSNLGAGTRVHLTFGAGVGMGMELVVSAGTGVGMKTLWVAGGFRAACSLGLT